VVEGVLDLFRHLELSIWIFNFAFKFLEGEIFGIFGRPTS